VEEDGVKTWIFYHYNLTVEYKDKPALPPPLIIIVLFWRAITYMLRKYNAIIVIFAQHSITIIQRFAVTRDEIAKSSWQPGCARTRWGLNTPPDSLRFQEEGFPGREEKGKGCREMGRTGKGRQKREREERKGLVFLMGKCKWPYGPSCPVDFID